MLVSFNLSQQSIAIYLCTCLFGTGRRLVAFWIRMAPHKTHSDLRTEIGAASSVSLLEINVCLYLFRIRIDIDNSQLPTVDYYWSCKVMILMAEFNWLHGWGVCATLMAGNFSGNGRDSDSYRRQWQNINKHCFKWSCSYPQMYQLIQCVEQCKSGPITCCRFQFVTSLGNRSLQFLIDPKYDSCIIGTERPVSHRRTHKIRQSLIRLTDWGDGAH